ncbi:alpha/beta-hydrolase [Dendrothele bispora CBS 962.96]|uniref:Alpha/beta-hydrolase n=1 Tax=Dendrothele bispora (strain CBS 962.96) TaxID=1314807 RepID=A0A4S8MZ03_DENBC|nr:alpha/beta-hydrolase [Dendrothele bispora CBS 962.96]
MADISEKLLTLSDGRVLAYAENGNIRSSTMVMFLHGLFGVGRCDRVSAGLRRLDVHVVNPTLPGFGDSSPSPTDIPYALSLAQAVNELIDHLHPDDSNLKIYFAGGSYGTVAAQILYGLPFDIFPRGRDITACVLLAPISPPRWHKEYTKCLTWRDYIGIGPPSQLIPFQLLPRLSSLLLRSVFRSVDKTEGFLRKTFFDNVSAVEKAKAAKWREEQGLAPGQFEREMAENAMKSFSKTWSGFIEAADVIHSDWLFKPDELDEEHSKRPIVIVPSSQDELGPEIAKWLASNYKNSTLRWVHGSHIAAAYEIDDIWQSVLVNS